MPTPGACAADAGQKHYQVENLLSESAWTEQSVLLPMHHLGDGHKAPTNVMTVDRLPSCIELYTGLLKSHV